MPVLRELIPHCQACKYSLNHCISLRLMHAVQYEAARREHAYGHPSSLYCQHQTNNNIKQHKRLTIKGAHIAMHAEAGRSRDREPLVLPI